MSKHLDKVRANLTGVNEGLCEMVDDAADSIQRAHPMGLSDMAEEALSALSAHEQEARELVEVVRKVVAWNTTYPSSRIYNETAIRRIAAEMDAIALEAEAALRPFEDKK